MCMKLFWKDSYGHDGRRIDLKQTCMKTAENMYRAFYFWAFYTVIVTYEGSMKVSLSSHWFLFLHPLDLKVKPYLGCKFQRKSNRCCKYKNSSPSSITSGYSVCLYLIRLLQTCHEYRNFNCIFDAITGNMCNGITSSSSSSCAINKTFMWSHLYAIWHFLKLRR